MEGQGGQTLPPPPPPGAQPTQPEEGARPRGFGAAEPPPPREPFTRAPWPALLLAASILAVFALQSFRGDVDGWNERFGLRPRDLFSGQGFAALVTALWSHASWAHAGLNAVFALAFGAPVARLFGGGLRGVALFLAFYLIGGVLASLGFALVHLGGEVVLVGASGAVSALTGAATRLIGANLGRDPSDPAAPIRLASFTSSGVVGMSFAFITSNLILGFIGIDLGQGDAPLAWEAHVAGFAAGILLISPFARLIARPAPSRPPESEA